jgi:2-oxoglutarate ferredoxin oxidoreductase subunit gamma
LLEHTPFSVADRKEVRLAGAGNHGMIEAGLILQEAAAIYDDKNAHHVQSYGPEARSNAARSEVIISDGDIDYPKATQLDVFLATTQEAVERYAGDLKPEGVLIVDEEVEYSGNVPAKTYRVPLLETCEKKLGKPALIHVVALGVLVEFSDVVTKPAIEAAVQDHVPRGGEELYMDALKVGYDLGKKALKS